MRASVMWFCVGLWLGGLASPSLARWDNGRHPETKSVNLLLKLKPFCYPVAYDEMEDRITVWCRGDPGWLYDAYSFYRLRSKYDNFFAEGSYTDLQAEYDNELGPTRWLRYWFNLMDSRDLPRLKSPAVRDDPKPID